MSAQPIRLWCVMKAFAYPGIEISGYKIPHPQDGPQRFIPVFNTREEAVKWNGSEDCVRELETFAETSALRK